MAARRSAAAGGRNRGVHARADGSRRADLHAHAAQVPALPGRIVMRRTCRGARGSVPRAAPAETPAGARDADAALSRSRVGPAGETPADRRLGRAVESAGSCHRRARRATLPRTLRRSADAGATPRSDPSRLHAFSTDDPPGCGVRRRHCREGRGAGDVVAATRRGAGRRAARALEAVARVSSHARTDGGREGGLAHPGPPVYRSLLASPESGANSASRLCCKRTAGLYLRQFGTQSHSNAIFIGPIRPSPFS